MPLRVFLDRFCRSGRICKSFFVLFSSPIWLFVMVMVAAGWLRLSVLRACSSIAGATTVQQGGNQDQDEGFHCSGGVSCSDLYISVCFGWIDPIGSISELANILLSVLLYLEISFPFFFPLVMNFNTI